SSYNGGGIANYGTLTVTSSTLSGNSASSYNGGGIANYGTLTVTSSTLSGNSASYGGGIANNTTLTLNISTLSGNYDIYSDDIYGFSNIVRPSFTPTPTNSASSLTASFDAPLNRIDFTVQVVSAGGPTATPTGTVKLYDSTIRLDNKPNEIGTMTLSSGKATF